MDLRVATAALQHGDAEVRDAEVLGFHEHFDPWRARVVLEVVGPGWRIPVDDAYAPIRTSLRRRFADRPFTADWALSGRFAGLVLGGPPAPWTAVAFTVALGAALVCGALGGPVVGVVVAIGLGFALSRVRSGVVVRPTGLSVGPAWAPEVPWHEVDRVVYDIGARSVLLRAWTPYGVSVARLPVSSWPACRARIRRLGGLVPERRTHVDLEERYRAARGLAVAAPWAVLAVGTVVGALSPQPFLVWTWTGLAASGAAFVGAAVEARISGWRTGGIFWMTAAYAVVLIAVLLAGVSRLP